MILDYTLENLLQVINFHPVSNGMVIGFKDPVFMIDICQYKKAT